MRKRIIYFISKRSQHGYENLNDRLRYIHLLKQVNTKTKANLGGEIFIKNLLVMMILYDNDYKSIYLFDKKKDIGRLKFKICNSVL